jgi:hypothetical protein
VLEAVFVAAVVAEYLCLDSEPRSFSFLDACSALLFNALLLLMLIVELYIGPTLCDSEGFEIAFEEADERFDLLTMREWFFSSTVLTVLMRELLAFGDSIVVEVSVLFDVLLIRFCCCVSCSHKLCMES